MQEPDFAGLELSTARVVVWGLGLMGGSLALALRSKCARLVGIDNDPAVVALATERGVVDAAFVDPRAGLDGADLIILALPVRVILTALAELAELCSTPAVIIDLGSTKTQIVVAMQNLPKRFEPLGGHPMCGKEKSSLANADALLYQHAPFGLVVLDRTGAAARRLAEELVEALGAHAVWIAAAEHDRWVAATSHLPFLLSSALAACTPDEASPLVGPGFRSTTRLAASSPTMMVDIMATNTQNVREALARFKSQIDLYDSLLESGQYADLAELFQQAAEKLAFAGNIASVTNRDRIMPGGQK